MMNRLEATKRLLKQLSEEIVVASLGNPTNDLFKAGHRPQNYYMRSAMGLASSVGLGMALAQPYRKVIVLDGDGSLLMNLGSLTTIAVFAPRNLVHVVWDNHSFSLTGGQPTHTARGIDLAAVARGMGVQRVAEAGDENEFESMMAEALTSNGPWFVVARITPEATHESGPLDPILIKHTFMRGIGTLRE